MVKRILFLIVSIIAAVSGDCEIGYFWQVTDIHYDSNYSHPSNDLPICQQGHGKFGEYPCDSPLSLVLSAIKFMAKIEPDPDFILWTGDNAPHRQDTETNRNKVFNILENVTEIIRKTFPATAILPTIGNHDIWPADQVPPLPHDQYYSDLLQYSGWDKLLNTSDLQEQFLKGGFYTHRLGHLLLVGLNTNLWNAMDRAADNITDPAGQLEWLEKQLKQARANRLKVLLHGHIPPGTWARAPVAFYYPHSNAHLLTLLRTFADVIVAGVFGHEHTDSFRLVYDEQGLPTIPLFIAPAITPWFNIFAPGVGANNPGVRLYQYCRANAAVLSYQQYYLNLSLANAEASESAAPWELEYDPVIAYHISNVSSSSLSDLTHSFITELWTDSITERKKFLKQNLFAKFFLYNSVSQSPVDTCSGNLTCQLQFVCSLLHVGYNDYEKCRAAKNIEDIKIGGKSSFNNHKMFGTSIMESSTFFDILGVSLIVIVMLAGVLFLVLHCDCCGKSKKSYYVSLH